VRRRYSRNLGVAGFEVGDKNLMYQLVAVAVGSDQVGRRLWREVDLSCRGCQNLAHVVANTVAEATYVARRYSLAVARSYRLSETHMWLVDDNGNLRSCLDRAEEHMMYPLVPASSWATMKVAPTVVDRDFLHYSPMTSESSSLAGAQGKLMQQLLLIRLV
jgi:hypothetical protein